MSAELIAKLESASEGSRELDEAVWLACGQPGQITGPVNYGVGVWSGPHVSYSIDAALALAERVLPGWCWGLATDRKRGFGCVVTPDEKAETSCTAYGTTPALAICAAEGAGS